MPRIAAAMTSLALVSAALLAGCSAAAGTTDPARLVKARCTRCHSTDRIEAAQHDKAAWTATVSRMRGKGAAVDEAEAAQIVDFLSGGGAASL